MFTVVHITPAILLLGVTSQGEVFSCVFDPSHDRLHVTVKEASRHSQIC